MGSDGWEARSVSRVFLSACSVLVVALVGSAGAATGAITLTFTETNKGSLGAFIDN